jgi:hypothetical protein
VIFGDAQLRWRWILLSQNNRRVARSKSYRRKDLCVKEIVARKRQARQGSKTAQAAIFLAQNPTRGGTCIPSVVDGIEHLLE